MAFLSSIIGGNFIGAQGFQGVQGIAGTTQGTQGLQGVFGTQGTQGTQGVQGAQGTQGRQGTQSVQGTQGLQGTQGVQGLSNQGTQGLQGVVGPPSSWTLVKKTVDESRNNTTTTSADSDLSFAMTSGVTYAIRGTIFITTTAAADLKYRFSGPTTSSVERYVRVANNNGTGSNPFLSVAFFTSLDAADVVATDNANGLVLIEMYATVTASANGNFEFWWAQNTSNAGPTTVFSGSYLEYLTV